MGFGLRTEAQEFEVGLFAGGSYYNGDINPGIPFIQTNAAYGGLIRYNFNQRTAARLSVFRGILEGDDAVSKFNEARGLNFISNITDISAVFEFNFLPYFTGSKRNYISTYIFGGASVFFFNPKSNGVELRNIGTEGQVAGFDGRKKYSKTGFSIPFGVGVKYSLTSKIGLGFEWGMHKTFTDYIDDISTTYYLQGSLIDPGNTAGLLSDPSRSHNPYMQRGDPKTKDWYSFAGVSITYKINIGDKARCLDQQNYN